MSASPALVCRGLVKRYGDVVAVNGLDLEVRRGECFGLLGPNGAGKTTTVEILEGLTRPDAGDVEVLGERWVGDGIALRRRLGIQLQETRFPDKLRVGEVIALFRSFYPRGLEPAEALRRVSLQEKSGAYVRGLSGGQKQRLSLACALAGDPEVLFLDEPSTGLDPASRREIWAVVEDLKARGRTVLLTTHYMEEAARLCDRVAIVDRGRLLSLGTPAALVASLGAEHVVEVEVDGEIAEEELRGLPGVEAVRVAQRTLRLTVRDVARVLPPLLALCAAGGVEVRRLTTQHASLEDVFMALAGRKLAGEEAA
ncbi:ABC transporter ATP-binding protein [Sorangium cellulosum]|uniref:Multidrug ABC transporter ATP-binding protein n=1 Tax=Sorangium cellulosum TaxID=56 RepID=A0A150Q8E9_SORCE|nr:ABC transporter ATP-binding protein [Sorangium cellulosum]KYF64249.1 multidrug ABC transporter ATP-binding protein [Sorangium cellulosum]